MTVCRQRLGIAAAAVAMVAAGLIVSASSGAAAPESAAPWHARLLDREPLTSLTSGAGSLYATVVGGTQVMQIVRINPGTGKVAARIGYPGQTEPPVIADGALWALWDGSPLRGLNLKTLATAVSIKNPWVGQLPVPPAAVAAGPDGTLYLAAGHAVAVVNPHTRRVVRTIRTPGIVGSLAVSPDGTRLYVALTGTFGQVKAYNTKTGAVTATAGQNARSARGLVATAGGVWGIGRDWIFFAPARDLSAAVRVLRVSGTGTSVSAAHGAVWLGGPGKLACASPVTGRIRVIVSTSGSGTIGDVSYVAGHAYAASTAGGVVTLQPPAACTA